SVRGNRAGRDDVVLPDHHRPVLRIRLSGAVCAVHRVHSVLTRLRPTLYAATVGNLQPALPLGCVLRAAVAVEILSENTRADHLDLELEEAGRAVAFGDRDDPRIDAGIELRGLAREAAVWLDREPAGASDPGKAGTRGRQPPEDDLIRGHVCMFHRIAEV